MTDSRLLSIYRDTLGMLSQLSIDYQLWQHEEILDFETDLLVAKRLGWQGVHTKSLFLKLKGGGYAIYLTDMDSRLDSKLLKNTLGTKVSICSNEEMIGKLGCVPGAVCPFATAREVITVVNHQLFDKKQLLFTPGVPTETVGFSGESLEKLLKSMPNQLIVI
ncbi:YbaK/EbsC family protein [Vibrio sonorensis]|uniref:YbaK/EbsC family protein n=1 Tax=Vibrio sonorensis TaxID=1004316 RepID=UPI0008DA01CD|nr:YbaK/EbsC family protein [Vibrio sonorensis]